MAPSTRSSDRARRRAAALALLLAACRRGDVGPHPDSDSDVVVPVRYRGATADGDLVLVTRTGDALAWRLVGSPRDRTLALDVALGPADGALRPTSDDRLGPLVVRDDLLAGHVTLDGTRALWAAVVEVDVPPVGTWDYVDRWCALPLPCTPPLDVTLGTVRFADDGRWGDCKEGFDGPDPADCPVGVSAVGAWSREDGRVVLRAPETGEVVGQGHLGAGLLVGAIPDQPVGGQGPGLFLGLPSVADVDLDGAWTTLRSDGTIGALAIDGATLVEDGTTRTLRPGAPRAGWITEGTGAGPILTGSDAGILVRTDAASGTWMELGVR